MKTRLLTLALASAHCVLCSISAAQNLQIANPHWNITLSDYGYSDYLLDNTPGFEGREYLSGEWGAAVGYQPAGAAAVTPQWLEPQFIFPDWPTHSPFHVVTPLAQTGLNADNLPVASSVIANSHLQITLRHEMLDTVTGTPMGISPASAPGQGTSIRSDRYVLKQTATLRNISSSTVSNIQFFQLLHSLQAQRGVYDDRAYPGPFSQFRHDVTQAGVDSTAVGPGSSQEGLEDFVAFHASVAPSAFEIGYFGVEGNGVDAHSIGKPSEGVHLSIENNWAAPPYAGREGTDYFAPAQRWIGGAQRWDLSNLAPGQSISLDLLLSLRTGTRVSPGSNSHGSCNGGSSVAGGVDYEFEDVSVDGSVFGEFSRADDDEISLRIAEGEFDAFTFLVPGNPVQLWELEFSGVSSGNIHLNVAYDSSLLPPGFDESRLALYHFDGSAWTPIPGAVNQAAHTIAITVGQLGTFALGVTGGASFEVIATSVPSNSGIISGAGPHAQGASATLVAVPQSGYAFSNWTENGAAVSTSPSYTFAVESNRTLTANFTPAGTGITVTTASEPANGGVTGGDGVYAAGASATVEATPNAGYKFSKWLINGTTVSSARSYTFPVGSNVTLTAKFKPVYSITAVASPQAGGEVEVDAAYEFGELAKLKAVPSPGYCFVNWTQNGLVVCNTQVYSFNVTGNRDLIANFAVGIMVTLFAEPANAGFVTGAGVYDANSTVAVDAAANPGYVFVNWTENGVPVSTSPTYAFTAAASCTVVANFIAQPRLSVSSASPGAIILSWPEAATDWFLEESPDVSGPWAASTRAVNVVGGQKRVTVDTSQQKRFFRLGHP